MTTSKLGARSAAPPRLRAARRLLTRLLLWFAARRLAHLHDESDFHRTLAVSLADEALLLERRIVLAQLELK